MLESGRAYRYEDILELMEQDYEISPALLEKITNFPEEFIRNPGKDTFPPQNRDAKEKKLYLADTMLFILSGFRTTEDDYLRAHMRAFERLGVKRSTLSRFVGISEESIEKFYDSPACVPVEEKYQIAVRFLAFEWFLSKRPDFWLEADTETTPPPQTPGEDPEIPTFEITI